MARGWRLYPDYERSDFGRSVRAALSSASRGAAWLAAQSGLNKGTISQVLNGRRACRPEHRRRIAEAILPHLEDHEQIDRLLRSAGLPPESPVWEAPFSSVLGSSDRRPSGDPADAATRAIDESLRSHRESGQVLSALDGFRSAAAIAIANGCPRVAARAGLNEAYLHFETDDLDMAAVIAGAVAGGSRESGHWRIAAEATQLLGRIDLRREDYDGARAAFKRSNAFLNRLGDASRDVLTNWPANLPRIGHSFVVRADTDVPEVVLYAGNLHFLSKTDLLEVEQSDLPRGSTREKLLIRGIRHIDEARALDSRSDAGHHIGLDLIVQSRFLGEMGQMREAKRRLDEGRSYLALGAATRAWSLARASVAASEGVSFRRAMRALEGANVSEAWRPFALAEIFDSQRNLYWLYRPRSWKLRALRYGLAAFMLQPFKYHARRLASAARAVREDEAHVKPLRGIVVDGAMQVLGFCGEFAPIGEIVRRLGPVEQKRLERNMQDALAIAAC